MQNNTTTNKTDNTKFLNKKPLNINLTSLKNDSMTDEIFDMTASMETNHHIKSDEIDRIFDANAIHCNIVENSTSDDSEQLKY